MALITSDITFDVLVFIALVTLGIYLYMTRNFDYWKKRGIREIPPIFFFGNIAKCFFAKQYPPQFLHEVYNEAEGERVVGFHVMDQPFLMVRDPELVQQVFIKDFSNFSDRMLGSSKEDVLGSTSVFLVKNPTWRYIRQKLTPVYTVGKIRKMFGLVMEICEDLKNHLDRMEIDEKVGKLVDIKELPAKFTTDVIGSTAFGLQLNSLNDPDAPFRKAGKGMFQRSYRRYLQWLSMLLVPQLRFFMKPKFFDTDGTNFLRYSFWQAIEERMKTGIKRNDMIDSLIDIKNKQDSDANDAYKLEGDELVAQAAIFFSGGFETSSTTTTFVLYELGRNPDIQQRVREEFTEALKENDGNMTYDLVMSLPYLDQVVHETLRIYPVLPWVDRITIEDYTFPGTNISLTSGVPVVLPMRMLQMDPKYFPEPERFDPDRFSAENKKNITPHTYFPFGEGPRACIGTTLGLLQTKIFLIHVLQKFELSPCKETPIPMQFCDYSVFCQAPDDLYLNFKKISN